MAEGNQAIDATALGYFRSQRRGSSAQKAKYKEQSLLMSYTEYFDLTPHRTARQSGDISNSLGADNEERREVYFDWLHTLVAGQNILLYGIGDHSNNLGSYFRLCGFNHIFKNTF